MSSSNGEKGGDRRVFSLEGGGEGGEVVSIVVGDGDSEGVAVEIGKSTENVGVQSGINVRNIDSTVGEPINALHS